MKSTPVDQPNQAQNSFESRSRKARTPKHRFPYFKFYARDWLDGTRGMTLEERGAYIDLICMLMEREGNLPDDEKLVSHQMCISTRKWRSVKAKLIEQEKIQVEGGLIIQERCLIELDSLLAQHRTSSESATNRERTKRENLELSNENNTHDTTVVPLRARVSDSDSERKEKDIPLPPSGDGERRSRLPEMAAAVAVGILGATLPAAAEPPPRAIMQLSPLEECRAAFDAYNDMAGRCGLKRYEVLIPALQQSIRCRMGEVGGLAGWKAVLAKVERSKFLVGETAHKHKANLDFIITPEKFSKIANGFYGDDRIVTVGGVKMDYRYTGEKNMHGRPWTSDWHRWKAENDEREALGEPLLPELPEYADA